MSLSPDVNGGSTIRLFRGCTMGSRSHGFQLDYVYVSHRCFFILTRASFKANEGLNQYIDRYRLHSHNGHQHRFYDFPCHRAYGYSRETP
jgi:hypothetical protein